MDILDDTWELPVTKDVSRALFTALAEEEQFDPSRFLLENNFQYTPLDALKQQLELLTHEMDEALVTETCGSYDQFADLCSHFSEQNETKPQLQKIGQDLTRFQQKLAQVAEVDVQTTKEVLSDTLDYLRNLDVLQRQLDNNLMLQEQLSLAKQLCEGLTAMVRETELEPVVCSELLKELYKALDATDAAFHPINHLDSPLLRSLRDEREAILVRFRSCLHVMVDLCTSTTNESRDQYSNEPLLPVLAAIYNAERRQSNADAEDASTDEALKP
ncbi:LAMI_0H04588g1_1 [Lachancea mirantina]|uniref:LAMI_0H04588g1_1 n=1 Tax=Lachancea mirantina TaxID=1230905 RepID=A0A1G4KEL9_9SACH|nr:LAMI_0H04588g1_1 [Lachancea mirantina]